MPEATSNGAIGKAMIVLRYLASKEAPVQLSEVAQRTQLAKSTVHRLLATLEIHGMVCRSGDRYALGDGIQHLAESARPRQRRHARLRRLLMPHLAELFESTHHAVSVAVLHHSFVLYLETIYPSSYAPWILRTGMRAPVHCTAAGKVLVAMSRCPRPDIIAPGTMNRFTRNTIDDPGRMEREFLEIRERGIAVSREEYLPGYVGMAAPVGGRADPVACFTVSGPAKEFDFESVEPLLRRTAHTASPIARCERF
ncbi:IclR family transcriptional regulator [Spirillospora sp. NPDC048911]|uniref:IclR family transcriptional regulator n=1 Tax=Spirillospora sp. NPDC048911 TaxID=3364527 RepID=UPI00371A1E95